MMSDWGQVYKSEIIQRGWAKRTLVLFVFYFKFTWCLRWDILSLTLSRWPMSCFLFKWSMCTLWAADELTLVFHWLEGNNWIVGWRELLLDSTLLVPLRLEVEPLPVLARTSALNTGLFPKLMVFTSQTQNPLYFLPTFKGDGDDDVTCPINFPQVFLETCSVRFLAAGRPLRACEEEFMGTCRKLI